MGKVSSSAHHTHIPMDIHRHPSPFLLKTVELIQREAQVLVKTWTKGMRKVARLQRQAILIMVLRNRKKMILCIRLN